MLKRGTLAVLFAVVVLLLGEGAQAGTGTLKGTFKYKNPSTGTEQILNYGFVYLRNATKPPPMEKYFSKADFVLGPTGGSPFVINNIPEGVYYLRLLQRKVVGGAARPYGPPEEGDYTWFQTTPFTITAGGTLNLGTVYATPFRAASIRVTGTLRSQQTGAPLPGRYIRAQTEPCYTDGENWNVNQCGPVKLLAQQTTDANGRYTMYLRDPGTYYFYVSPCLTTYYDEYTGNRCGITPGTGAVTLSLGDEKTVDMTIWATP